MVYITIYRNIDDFRKLHFKNRRNIFKPTACRAINNIAFGLLIVDVCRYMGIRRSADMTGTPYMGPEMDSHARTASQIMRFSSKDEDAQHASQLSLQSPSMNLIANSTTSGLVLE